MLFSGIATRALAAGAPGTGALVAGSGARLKKIKELITRAIADTSKVTVSTILGHRGALIGRTLTPGGRFLFPRLSFSGICGLPRLALWRLTRYSLRPYFT